VLRQDTDAKAATSRQATATDVVAAERRNDRRRVRLTVAGSFMIARTYSSATNTSAIVRRSRAARLL
jgi:hypothetical protein